MLLNLSLSRALRGRSVLQLSKGETLGDKTIISGNAKSNQEKLKAEADDATAKSKQLQEENKKIAKLEVMSKEASKLVELKEQATPPKEKVSEPKPTGLPAVASAVPVTEPKVEEFDIMAMLNEIITVLLDDPVLLGGVAVALLALAGLGIYLARRGKVTKKKGNKKSDDIGTATGSWRTPVAPSADTGDFTKAVEHIPVVATLDDVDPISEADLFLNFGRDTQAEEILKDALTKNPANIQVKLKLLSIYTNRKDSKSFSKYAQEIKDSGDASAWERASVMGREVDPTNPSYGDAKGEVRQREPAKAEVDFDLGFGKQASLGGDNSVAEKDFKMDFDLSASQSVVMSKPVDLSAQFSKTVASSKPQSSADVDATSILSREVVNSAQSASPMDFDVSGILPSDAKNIGQSTMMNIDISGILPGEVKKIAEPVSSMDFDISENYSLPAERQEASPSQKPESAAINFDDLVFEIPSSTSSPAVDKAKPVENFKADDGMAFTIDFPLGEKDEPIAQPIAAHKLDMDFGDININLDEDVSPARADGDGKDEHWHEVATKLDLAKAYQEMGDADGAREILEEVIRDGDVTQREVGAKLLQQIAV
jgi:pilus assembly protein FimV